MLISKGQILVSTMDQYKGEGTWSADVYRLEEGLDRYQLNESEGC